jgi:FAD/FMN-containing dehydrogenase
LRGRARHRARRSQPPAQKHGLWFPVDVSTASRATIGGMAGNNSCGGRSLRYGTMRDNTLSMDAALAGRHALAFRRGAAGSGAG